MTTTQIRSTAAAFLTALSTPDVFGAWAAVPKDDKVAIGKFFAQTLGLAQAPTSDELTALESAILEMTGQTTPDVRAPQHVGFIALMQHTPRHVGVGYIQQDQPTPRHVGFAYIQQDQPIPQHVGIGYVQQGQPTPQHVGLGYVQQNAPETRAPQHVGFIFLMQQAATKLNADQHRAIAAGFLGALASPTVFQAWTAVPKDDRSAVAAFIRDAIGLAESPTEGDLAAIETLVQEMLSAQAVDVKAPRHVAFMVLMQQAHATQTLSEVQLHGIAAGFVDALKTTPSVFERWIATPKNDRAAIGNLVADALGLASAPTADELEIMANYIEAALKPQVEAITKQDQRVPRHVGFLVLMQQETVASSISDADLRELLQLSQLTAGE